MRFWFLTIAVIVAFLLTGVTVSGGSWPELLFDFELDDGGFEGAGDWEWGEPAGGGPQEAHSGVKCWGTSLTGDYSDLADFALKTPGFYLVAPVVEFSFWQWYRFEEGRDGGWFEISRDGANTWEPLEPVGGYPGTIEANGKTVPAYTGHSAGWEEATFDLTPFFGEFVSLGFHMYSDSAGTEKGWFIDDVVLSGGDVGLQVGIGETSAPSEERLAVHAWQKYPGGAVSISYEVPSSLSGEEMRLEVFDLRGRVVTERTRKKATPGEGTWIWDGGSSGASSGIYFVRLEVGKAQACTKFLLLR